MFKIPSPTGPLNYGETSWENPNSGETKRSFTAQAKSLVEKASAISIMEVVKLYNLNLDYNKICCPFKHHKNGSERTASLYIYPETNTFYCFGCKTGSSPVDFVANIEGINRLKAAQKLLSTTNFTIKNLPEKESYKDKIVELINFSNFVRESQLDPIKKLKALKALDKLLVDNKLTTEAIKFTCDKLRNYLK